MQFFPGEIVEKIRSLKREMWLLEESGRIYTKVETGESIKWTNLYKNYVDSH